MLKHFGKKEPVLTDLTWEEKNPTNYLYRSPEALEILKKWEKMESEEDEESE